MIAEDYVSFEIAKLLKEKGFNEPTYHDYDEKERRWFEEVLVCHNSEGGIACPTIQMTMKWLREIHGVFIAINIVPNTTITMEQRYYFFKLYKNRRIYNFPLDYSVQFYKTYEEACESAIKYCLENLI